MINNPADCIEEENERAETQVIHDLRAMLYYLANAVDYYPIGYMDLMRRSFDILHGRTLENGVTIDKKSIYSLIDNAQRNHESANKDNPFVRSTDISSIPDIPVIAMDLCVPEYVLDAVAAAAGESPDYLKPQSQANRGWS